MGIMTNVGGLLNTAGDILSTEADILSTVGVILRETIYINGISRSRASKLYIIYVHTLKV